MLLSSGETSTTFQLYWCAGAFSLSGSQAQGVPVSGGGRGAQ